MSMLGKLLSKAGSRLVVMGRRGAFSSLPGSISVGKHRISDLKPLGGVRCPGITKVGRLSFSGVCAGRKVKVYSAHSPDQVRLRLAVQTLPFVGCAFPKVIAANDRLIVEEWVEGTPVNNINESLRSELKSAVIDFLSACRSESSYLELAGRHGQSFCYFENYLIPRLGAWANWDPVRDFITSWQTDYCLIDSLLPKIISHPDLSAANLILQKDTGRLVIIDNELLGVGSGWLLDARNSLLMNHHALGGSPVVTAEFLEKTWRLRLLGSALDRGDLLEAHSIVSGR